MWKAMRMIINLLRRFLLVCQMIATGKGLRMGVVLLPDLFLQLRRDDHPTIGLVRMATRMEAPAHREILPQLLTHHLTEMSYLCEGEEQTIPRRTPFCAALEVARVKTLHRHYQPLGANGSSCDRDLFIQGRIELHRQLQRLSPETRNRIEYPLIWALALEGMATPREVKRLLRAAVNRIDPMGRNYDLDEAIRRLHRNPLVRFQRYMKQQSTEPVVPLPPAPELVGDNGFEDWTDAGYLPLRSSGLC